ncbi:MAG: ATP-binding protein [Planctomycetota bacterium]
MKIGNKLIIGFLVIASLVGFVGIFSAISHNNIQANNEIVTKVLELDTLIDESLVKLLALIQTGAVEDYIREKTDYEEIRAEFDSLFKQLNNEYAKKLPDLGFNVEAFNKDAGELAKISNGLIAIHKRCLAKNKVFKEKESLEKELRHKTIPALAAIQDNALTRDADIIQYKSKEAIYQYKDQKHSVEWLEAISKVKNNSLIAASQDVSKDLNAYERVAQDICKITVEQNTIEKQEHLVFGELKELINRLEENQGEIAGKIKAESRALARNTHLTMFAVIAGAFLVSIILGLTIAHSISKPVISLAQTTQAIAQGDFSVRVDVATAGEIGDLAASFNKMAENLQKTTTSVDNLNNEIIERKQVEEALGQSEHRFRQLISSSPTIIYTCETSDDYATTFVSGNIKDQFGYNTSEFTQNRRFWIDNIHPDDRERVLRGLGEIAEKGICVCECRFRHKDGSWRWVQNKTVILRDEEGEILELIGSLIDITKQKIIEKERKKIFEKLREYNRLKDELIANVSHELRTPLTIFKNLVSNALAGVRGEINEKLAKDLQTADKEIDRLGRIISNFLDISRINAGRIKIEVSSFDIREVIREAAELWRPVFTSKDTKINTLLPNCEQVILADKDRIMQVVTNLLANALKFVPSTDGIVEIRLKDIDDEVCVEVEDNGKGMGNGDIKKVFSRFVQIGRQEGPGEHGTGLGLAICRALIEIHGGRIWVESEEGRGSKFCFSLPKNGKKEWAEVYPENGALMGEETENTFAQKRA